MADSGRSADAIRLLQGALQTNAPFAQREEAKALLAQLDPSQPKTSSEPLPLPAKTGPTRYSVPVERGIALRLAGSAKEVTFRPPVENLPIIVIIAGDRRCPAMFFLAHEPSMSAAPFVHNLSSG